MSTGFDELLWAVTNYDPEHPDYEELSDIGDGQYLASAAADLIQELRRGLAAAQAEIECEERRFSEQQDLLHSVIQERDAAQAEVRELQRVQSDVLANLDAPDDMDVISAAHFVAGSLSTAEEALEAAQAEARELRAELAVRNGELAATEKLLTDARAELARVRELPAKWRAAPQNPDEPLLAMAADELDAALSRAAEQHDPLAVSDHCPECSEPEPECVCGEQPAERESLPLMARRSWMRRDTDYFVVRGDFCLEIKALNGRAPYYDEGGELVVCAEAGDSIERDQVDAEAQPDGIYRIADTDEHGLPVVERTADMPKRAKYRITWITQADAAGGDVEYTDSLPLALEANRSGAVSERIEDYRPAAQESDQ